MSPAEGSQSSRACLALTWPLSVCLDRICPDWKDQSWVQTAF